MLYMGEMIGYFLNSLRVVFININTFLACPHLIVCWSNIFLSLGKQHFYCTQWQRPNGSDWNAEEFHACLFGDASAPLSIFKIRKLIFLEGGYFPQHEPSVSERDRERERQRVVAGGWASSASMPWFATRAILHVAEGTDSVHLAGWEGPSFFGTITPVFWVRALWPL